MHAGNTGSVASCVSQDMIYSKCLVFTFSGPSSLTFQSLNSVFNGVFSRTELNKLNA